jgi:hypothetical protein
MSRKGPVRFGRGLWETSEHGDTPSGLAAIRPLLRHVARRVWRPVSTLIFKGSQFEKDIILWGVRWYVAYPISYRQLEEMMGERGVAVDHSTLNRWVIKYAPEFEKQFRRRQQPVGKSWRLDETYVKIGSVLDLDFMRLHRQTKLIAINKQANDDVVQLDRFRKAERFPREPLNAGAQRQMLAFNLLRVPFARDMSFGRQLPGIRPPMIGKEARDAEGLQ